MFDDFFIIELMNCLEGYGALLSMPGKIENVGALLPGKPDSPQLRRLEFENSFRRQFGACRLEQAIEDRVGCLAAQLLIHDGTDQRIERRLAEPDAVWPYFLDDAPQYRIGFLKMYDGFTHRCP